MIVRFERVSPSYRPTFSIICAGSFRCKVMLKTTLNRFYSLVIFIQIAYNSTVQAIKFLLVVIPCCDKCDFISFISDSSIRFLTHAPLLWYSLSFFLIISKNRLENSRETIFERFHPMPDRTHTSLIENLFCEHSNGIFSINYANFYRLDVINQ